MNKIFSLRTILSCAFLFLAIGWASAQKATLKGVVVDSSKTGDDRYLMGANVVLTTMDGEFVDGAAVIFDDTEFDFMYKIEGLDPGQYKATYSYLGYEAKEITVNIAAGETKELIVGLALDMMEIVIVTGDKGGTTVKKSTITVDAIGADLVDNTAASKVDDAVARVPGVTVVDGQANIRGGSGYSYGAGSRVLILVDDIPFMSGDAGMPNWRDIPIENVNQIEVLKGAASALYGSSALNGIINIRTAYARGEPVSKISVFNTQFMPMARPETVWWNDSINARIDGVDTTFLPRALAGPKGYRKPQEWGLQFAHRQKFGKFDLTVGGNLFSQDAPLGGMFERKFRINTNMRYRFSDLVNAGVALNYNMGQSGNFFIWGSEAPLLDDSGENVTDSLTYFTRAGAITVNNLVRFSVDPFFTLFDKNENRHRVQGRIYYVDNQNGNNQANTSILSYLEYQNQSTFKKLDNLKMVAGAVGQYTYSTAELYGNAQYQISNFAGYIQLDKGFFRKPKTEEDRLIVSFGARYEYNSIKSPDSILLTSLSPDLSLNPEPLTREGKPVFRLGLNYEIAKATFLRASWGQGYRFPTVAERYIATSIDQIEIRPNPTLQSETGWSAELGIKQGFKITDKWKGFADASFFWTQYQDMMEFTFGGGDLSIYTDPASVLSNLFFQSVNIGDTRIVGTELSVMGTGTIGDKVKMNLIAGYTYIDPRFQAFDSLQQQLSSSTENILKYRSRHTAKFDIEGFFIKKMDYPLSFGLSMQYNSETQAVDRVFENIFFAADLYYDVFGIDNYRQNINRGQFTNLGARVAYRHSVKKTLEGGVKKEVMGIKLSLVANNLLNQEYAIRPGLSGMPMNFVTRLDIDF